MIYIDGKGEVHIILDDCRTISAEQLDAERAFATMLTQPCYFVNQPGAKKAKPAHGRVLDPDPTGPEAA